MVSTHRAQKQNKKKIFSLNRIFVFDFILFSFISLFSLSHIHRLRPCGFLPPHPIPPLTLFFIHEKKLKLRVLDGQKLYRKRWKIVGISKITNSGLINTLFSNTCLESMTFQGCLCSRSVRKVPHFLTVQKETYFIVSINKKKKNFNIT